METNELQKELQKAQRIIDALFYDEKAITQWQHRLLEDLLINLQSKEEELNRFKKEIELLKLESDNAWSKAKSLTSEVERLRALCDKGDRILRETDSYALRIDSLCRVLIKVREALESQSFLSGNTNLVVVLKQEIDTLLSQSTDKQP